MHQTTRVVARLAKAASSALFVLLSVASCSPTTDAPETAIDAAAPAPVLPVTATDLLAHTQRAIHFTFVVNPQQVTGTARRREEDSPEADADSRGAVLFERFAQHLARSAVDPERVGGDSFVAAVEFPDPARARALLAYGNATQPGSPQAGDQLELFAKKELRPVWRTREEIEAHLERREVLARSDAPDEP